MRCLIVEDETTARVLIREYLKDHFVCDVAADGGEGVDAFKMRLEKNDRFDLICLDIMMPGMGGHEALKKIREIEAEHNIGGLERVKVIMTTALGDSKNVFDAFREGCEAYVVKPVNKEKLYEQIEKLGLTVTT